MSFIDWIVDCFRSLFSHNTLKRVVRDVDIVSHAVHDVNEEVAKVVQDPVNS